MVLELFTILLCFHCKNPIFIFKSVVLKISKHGLIFKKYERFPKHVRLVDNVEISKCVENVFKVIVLRLTLARIMSLTVTKNSSNQPLRQDKPRSVNLTRYRSNTVTQCLLTRNGFSLK